MPSKKKSQKKHAKRRAFERYGIVLNEDELKQIASYIRKGKADLIRKRSNRVSVYMVRWKDKSYPVVYDRLRRTIVTFLPERQ